MEDPSLLAETGWSPEALDNIPQEILDLYLLYRAVKNVNENGGNLQL